MIDMKRKRCTKCKHTMKGHKKRNCREDVRLESDGRVYIGSVYEGVPSGRGRLEMENSTYIGFFLAGKKHGTGTEVTSVGRTYTGEWENDKYHGPGRLVYGDRRVREGTFYHGRLHGFGTAVTTVSSYVGQFHHGIRQGQGTLTTHSGVYVGTFLYGEQHGRGCFTWTNGDIYSGNWRRGMRYGIGLMTDATSTYTGNWRRDLRHGLGTCVCTQTGVYEGQWKKGRRHNQGTQTYANGVQYVGGWCRGEKTGHGTQRWPNGDHYVGFWSSGTYCGRGMLTLHDVTYTGEWSDGKRWGMFVETRVDGTRWSGPWSDDVRLGIFYGPDNKRRMYIRDTLISFDHVYEAKEAIKRAIGVGEIECAMVIGEFYPSIVSWSFLFDCDQNGRLLELATREQIHLWTQKHSWTLYRKGRYAFIEALVSRSSHERIQRVAERVPELFDQITHDFVADPWMVHSVSYSAATKTKLLRGLHLGEFGRCPPKDPFTRQLLTESSGTYLHEKAVSVARKVYCAFMGASEDMPTMREMAYSFDLEDFELSLRNARAAKDTATIRRLMKERNLFIQQGHSNPE